MRRIKCTICDKKIKRSEASCPDCGAANAAYVPAGPSLLSRGRDSAAEASERLKDMGEAAAERMPELKAPDIKVPDMSGAKETLQDGAEAVTGVVSGAASKTSKGLSGWAARRREKKAAATAPTPPPPKTPKQKFITWLKYIGPMALVAIALLADFKTLFN